MLWRQRAKKQRGGGTMFKEISEKVYYEQRLECEEGGNTISNRRNNSHKKTLRQEQFWNLPEAQGRVMEKERSSQVCVELARNQMHAKELEFYFKYAEKPGEDMGRIFHI